MVNIGFVNCEWALKGQFKEDTSIKVVSEGQTYDDKLYTFNEINYEKEFEHLIIFTKEIDELRDFRNVPSVSSYSSSVSASVEGSQDNNRQGYHQVREGYNE